MKIPLIPLCLFLTTTIAAKGPLSESRLSTHPYHTGTGTGTGTGYPYPTITGVQPTHTPCSPYNTTGTSKPAPVRRAGAYPYKRDADWSSHGWCAPPPATGSGVVKSHGSPSHSHVSYPSASQAPAGIKKRRSGAKQIVTERNGTHYVPDSGPTGGCGTGCGDHSTGNFVSGIGTAVTVKTTTKAKDTSTHTTTIENTHSSSTEAGAATPTEDTSNEESPMDESDGQTSAVGDNPTVPVETATETSEPSNPTSTQTTSPEADEEAETSTEETIDDAIDSLGDLHRDLSACDTPECTALKLKINSWRSEMVSVGDMVATATSGWAGQHDSEAKTTEALPSSWSVTYTQPSAATTTLIGTTETPDSEQASQEMFNTSSMPPAEYPDTYQSEQDTTMTESSTESIVTQSLDVPTNTDAYDQAATKISDSLTIDSTSAVTSKTVTWNGIGGSGTGLAFTPASSILASPMVGQEPREESGYATASGYTTTSRYATASGYAMPSDEGYGPATYQTGGVAKPTTLLTKTSSRNSTDHRTPSSSTVQKPTATLNAPGNESVFASNIEVLLNCTHTIAASCFASSTSTPDSEPVETGYQQLPTLTESNAATSTSNSTISFAQTPSVDAERGLPAGLTPGEAGTTSTSPEAVTSTTTIIASLIVTPSPVSVPADEVKKRGTKMVTGAIVSKDSLKGRRRGFGGLKGKRFAIIGEAHNA